MIGAALNIVLNYVFIKMFGYVAAGYTTFVCYLVYCIGHYIFVEHIIKKKFGRHLIDWKYLAILFVLLVVLMILMSLTYKWPMLRYGIIVALLICVVAKRRTIIDVLKVIKRK